MTKGKGTSGGGRWGVGGGGPALLKVGSSLGRAAATVPALPDPSGRTHLSRVRVPEARPRLRPARLGPKPAGGREGLPRGGSGGGGTRVRRGRGANSPALRLPLARAPRRHLEAEERAEARGGRGGQGRMERSPMLSASPGPLLLP
ncbi:translation initiation factor IF-2-like [Cervus canadensis]|uniref:translation initiation factor IF-2-like n=1 Tax=Cervus canadensis TaxID=1574408 RepID=UPI001C9E3FCB|nr:translation initiation factor IF-2-like [Cervus canadensis]